MGTKYTKYSFNETTVEYSDYTGDETYSDVSPYEDHYIKYKDGVVDDIVSFGHFYIDNLEVLDEIPIDKIHDRYLLKSFIGKTQDEMEAFFASEALETRSRIGVTCDERVYSKPYLEEIQDISRVTFDLYKRSWYYEFAKEREFDQRDLKIDLRRKRKSLPLSKEEEKEKLFKEIEKETIRNRAKEAFTEERQKNPKTRKRIRDFKKELTKEEQALIHYQVIKDKYRKGRV